MAGESGTMGGKRPEGDRSPRQRRPGGSRRWVLPAFALGCLLGRATLLGLPGLYGAALAAAVRGAGRSHGAELWAVAGCLVGSLSLFPAGPAAAGAAAGTLVAALVPPGGAPGRTAPARAAAGGVVAALLARGSALDLSAPSLIFLALAGGLAAVMAGVLARGRAEAEVAGLAGPEGQLAAVLLAVAALSAVPAGLRVGNLSLPVQAVLASGAVATVAWGWGGPHGAAAGVLVALAGVLAPDPTQGNLRQVADLGIAYAAAGLAAGGCRLAGRLGVVLGYGLTFVLLFLHDPGLAAGLGGPGAALVGLALAAPFWPKLRPLVLWAGKRPTAPGVTLATPLAAGSPGEGDFGALLGPLEALAQVLWDISRRAPATGAREAAATGAREAAATAAAPDALAPIVGEVHERICQGCASRRQCWEVHFHRTYQTFSQLWRGIEADGPLSLRTPPPALARFCRYASEVAAVMNGVHDLHAARRQWERQLQESRQEAWGHLGGVARLLDQLAAEVRAGGDGRRGPGSHGRPVLAVCAGTARVAKRGNLLSGDSTVAVPIGKGRYLLGLSDGMGAGREAAEESRLALGALETLLKAGYRLESAIQAVNSCLLLRQGGDRFPTLDVVLIDCHSARAHFAKLGAAPSLLRRGSRVQVLRAETPPAGVLEPLPLELQERVLHPGDCILLLSDGVWEVKGEGRREGEWLVRALQAGPLPDRPEALAETLLARALEQAAGPEDDMTVLAAYLVAGDEEAGDPEGGGVAQRPGEPVPVRRAVRNP
ncbi:MAG: SpoIIE family protein phosphatase [Firmicutes bacterium]|nr:SpoIIE family protein phosphatase [Bacillota bacterium]